MAFPDQIFMLRDSSYLLSEETPIEDAIIVYISLNELSNKQVFLLFLCKSKLILIADF